MIKGYKFYIITTLVIALQFVNALLFSQILPIMDIGGTLFYIASCISHAACIAVIPFVVYTFLYVIHLRRIAIVTSIVISSLLSILILVDEQVFQLYRFHINGFVINMLTGPAATDIFNFDTMLYFKYASVFILAIGIYSTLWLLLCEERWKRVNRLRRYVKKYVPILVIVLCTLFAHVYHIYAAFYTKLSVIQSERLLPYYFPTTSYGFMTEVLGLNPINNLEFHNNIRSNTMLYPKHELQTEPSEHGHYNILIILIDSWNPRSFTHDCMPNIYQYALENQWYSNHVSCSNGTKSSVFGLWYGIPSYYWDIAESNHVTPVLLDVAHKKGYKFYNYPSASHIDPPFGKVIFAREKNVRITTPGNTSYERDKCITSDFIQDISNGTITKSPFISFLFYDLPHSFEYNEEYARFKPSWKYPDYSSLSNDTEPTPFWNLYRNTCYAVDKMVGNILDKIKAEGLDKNTVVIITGDHGQEFNENHKNYWGHNGNFSRAQIGIPLIVHFPDNTPMCYTHRTTHYDISTTLLKSVLGVKNPESDFSMGHLLNDKTPRLWHIVGSELNYGFIIDKDTILEKSPTGGMNVYDANMSIVEDYQLNAAKFKSAIDRLNQFMR